MTVDRPRAPRRGTERRREEILRHVRDGSGDIAGLAARFGVSVSTVRRDLQHLAGDGHVHRTYGGAVAGGHVAERTLDEKESGHRAQKEAIARAAAERVADGDVVLIDAGTTTGRFARALRSRSRLTVITNSTLVLRHLADAPGIELIVLGGRVRRPNGAILGPEGEETLRRLTPDLAVLGADGLDARNGLSCPSLGQAHAKELMAERGREVLVLADATKLGAGPFPYHARPAGPWTLVTDASADPAIVREFTTGPIDVLTVPAQP
ncbi:DeoR/GlpR family DNA-binding transcription regulator [Streptomyces meridianus]|uniref:DeoR/GlpR family DNA-binding transcription regulator n=1 Tax=Streptomyces meridianus TaxID=2938945 RepID=A0ABT0XF86_9ACTN|nr:DeoR/GlpR family DNA-binding transcription regulator [Streptomyces meridianus]MCM2580623.1 DeoR/GlpR family DNA-binding transcription regulator [Streptomyces meridianus]